MHCNLQVMVLLLVNGERANCVNMMEVNADLSGMGRLAETRDPVSNRGCQADELSIDQRRVVRNLVVVGSEIEAPLLLPG